MANHVGLDAFEVGDVVCLLRSDVSTRYLKLATPDVLEECRVPYAIVRQVAAEGGPVSLRLPSGGVPVPPDESGIGDAGWVRVGEDGRPELVDEPDAGDFVIGQSTDTGAFFFDPRTAWREPADAASIGGLLVDLEGAEDGDTLGIVDGEVRPVPPLPRDPHIYPNGEDQEDEIQAALAVAHEAWIEDGFVHTVQLEAGEFRIGGQLILPSGVRLAGRGIASTWLVWTGAAGVLSSPTNAMIRAAGALNLTKLDSIPTTTASGAGTPYYPPGTERISVANAGFGTLAPPDFVFIEGTNNPAYAEYQSSPGTGLLWSDLLQVSSIVVNAGDRTLHLAHDVLSYHTVTNGGVGTPMTVRGCDPCVSAGVEGLTLDGGNMAVGVSFEFCHDVRIKDVGFTRFALAGIHGKRSRRVAFEGLLAAGALNGLWFLDAVHSLTVSDCRGTDQGERYCSVGRGFGWGCAVNNCSVARIYDNEIVHFGIGLYMLGIRAWTHSNNVYRDLDCELYATRDTAVADSMTLGVIGIAIHHGGVTLSVVEFSSGWTDTGTVIIDARHARLEGNPQNADHCSYWHHDVTDCLITGLKIHGKGKSPYQNIDGVVRYMSGIRGHDANGSFSNVIVSGCEYSLRINAGGFIMDRVTITPQPSMGTIPVVGIMFDSGFGVIGAIELNHVTTQSIYFQGTYEAQGDYSGTVMRDLTLNDQRYEGPMYVAKNSTGAVLPGGAIAALRNNGTTYIREMLLVGTSGAGQLVRACANAGGFGIPNNGHGFFDFLPNRGYLLCKTADAVPMGSLLKHEGGSSIYATPLGSGPSVGTALQYKAAGVATNGLLVGEGT